MSSNSIRLGQETSPLLQNGIESHLYNGSDHSEVISASNNCCDKKEEQKFRVYKRRWWILCLASVLYLVQSCFWLTYNSVGNHVLNFYQMTQATQNMIASLGMILFIIVVVPSAWLLERHGLRIAVLIATALVLATGLLRCFAQKPTDLWIIFVAQILNGAAGPIVMSIPAQVSIVWFAPGERTLATAILVLAGNMGSGVAFLLGMIVKEDAQFMNLVYIEAIIAMAIALPIYVYYPAEPPTPPSISTSLIEGSHDNQNDVEKQKTQLNIWQSLRRMFTNRAFVLLAISGGFMSGSYGGWQSVLEPILLPLHFTENEVAWIGFYAITAGSAGALLLGKLADMFFIKRFKLLLVIGFILTIISFVFFSASTTEELTFVPHNYWIVVITSTIGGMTLNAILPLFYEFSVELTYPAPGGTSGAVLSVIMNIGSLIFVVVDDFAPAQWMNWILCGCLILAFVLLFFVKEEYRRVDVDQNDTSKIVNDEDYNPNFNTID